MTRSENIEKLETYLSLDEDQDYIIEQLAKILADKRKRNIFMIKLKEMDELFSEIDIEIKLTHLEEAVYRYIKEKKETFTAKEISNELGSQYLSLRHRNHSSATLNSLVSKGQLGKIKQGHAILFADPLEAVMWSLKKRNENYDDCLPELIVEETGLPLGVVLEKLDELK